MSCRFPRLMLCVLAFALVVGPWAHAQAPPAPTAAMHCLQHESAAPVTAPTGQCCQQDGGCGCVHAGLMLAPLPARVMLTRPLPVATACTTPPPVSQTSGLFRPPI